MSTVPTSPREQSGRARAVGTPLQRRLLAIFDDSPARDEVTAADLAARLSLPEAEVQTELEVLADLGNLARVAGRKGQTVYSAAPRRRLLGNMLVESGHITEAQLQSALAEQAKNGEMLGTILHARGLVSKEKISELLETQRGVPHVSLAAYPIDEALVRALPEEIIKQHKVFPLARVGRDVHVAMLDPTDIVVADTVASYLGGHVRPFLTTERDFDWALTRFFDVKGKVGESLQQIGGEQADEWAAGTVTVTESADDPPLVRLVDSLIQDAVRLGATDIHIEPDAEQAQVRYRMDGLLYDKAVLPRSVAGAVATRLKVLAGMDIAERLRPQDGRILLNTGVREYDLRLATVGTTFGERVAVRLLTTRSVLLGLERLGLFPEQQEILRRLLGRPHGMVLVTGPTGSGKTTTLYASISHVNERTRNVMTIEDPVEYRLPGITQIPVREKAGVTFGIGLRAILRQDPDVVMIGEIRDPETASIGIQAALTGHLVLSTLHTNNAPSAPVRLMDMGIEPYLLTSAVLAVIGQRLIRILCSSCAMRYDASEPELALLGLREDMSVALYHGVGCPECGGRGYKGRTGVFELLVITDTIRELILQRRPSSTIMAAARAGGMATLRESAVRKVLDGVTSVDELQRLIVAEVD